MATTKTVGEVMTRDVVTLFGEDSLANVAENFARYRFRNIPVVDEGKLVGLVTQRDILRLTLDPSARSTMERTRDARLLDEAFVEEIMRSDPITAQSGETIAVAAARMYEHRVSALPVVDAAGMLIGILAAHDVLGELAKLAT